MDNLVSGKRLAAILGVSGSEFKKLGDSGVLPTPGDRKLGWNVLECVKSFVAYTLASVPDTDLESELKAAKARKIKYLAAFETAKVSLMEGTSHRVVDVVSVVGDMVSTCRGRLLAGPSRLGRVLLAQNDEVVIGTLLMEPINEALAEIRDYNPDDFNSRCKDYILGFKNNENIEKDETDDPD
jgi:hypothetical protein